jgi:hypothetical protein
MTDHSSGNSSSILSLLRNQTRAITGAPQIAIQKREFIIPVKILEKEGELDNIRIFQERPPLPSAVKSPLKSWQILCMFIHRWVKGCASAPRDFPGISAGFPAVPSEGAGKPPSEGM